MSRASTWLLQLHFLFLLGSKIPFIVPWPLDANGLPATPPYPAARLPIAVLCPSGAALHFVPSGLACGTLCPGLLSPPVTSFCVFGVSTAHHLPLSFVPECLPPELVNALYACPQHQARSLPDTRHILVFNCWLYAVDLLPGGQDNVILTAVFPEPVCGSNYLCGE